VDSDARLRLVVGAAGLTIAEAPVPLPSNSNDAWKIGELVLRICWRGDRSRVRREALVLEHLPEGVPHPPLVAAGEVDDLSWTLTRWLPGRVEHRRVDVGQLGEAMCALHAWDPPPEVKAALAVRPADSDMHDVIGADLNPLPVDRALRLVEPATHLDHVDPQLVIQLGEQLQRLRSVDPLTNPTDGVVVHGDAHLNNVIWNGTLLVALLDYEWARLGPPDLELQPLLLSADAAALIPSVVDAYPGIAAHPRVVERLWLYDLSATLRDLLVKAPLRADGDLPSWHPKRRLPLVLEGPGYIEALLSGT
jgi:aminoglycoside phosphotransferase (APT) family kinase protein